MAEAGAAPEAGHGTFGVLGHKVGPFPVLVWGLLGFGAYWLYTHYGPGASASSTPAQNAMSAIKGAMSWPAAKTTTTSGTGATTGGTGKDRDRKDRDRRRPDRKRKDRDARGHAAKTATTTRTPGGTETFSASAPVASQPTGQPVGAGTGQPVYWEWTHAHRSPDVAYPASGPVPEPQQAYAPMTGGAIYNTDTSSGDASAGAAAALAGAAGA